MRGRESVGRGLYSFLIRCEVPGRQIRQRRYWALSKQEDLDNLPLFDEVHVRRDLDVSLCIGH